MTSGTGGELYILGGTAVTMNAKGDIVEDAVIHVRGGKIASISADGPSSFAGARVVDARGCLVLPGFINGHTHVGMSLLRGIADDLPLHRWLHERVFPLEQKWSGQGFVRASTELACLEMIRSGTTTFNDMYYFEETVAEVVHEAGLRSVCGQTLIEISGVGKKPEAVFGEFDTFLDKVASYPRVRPALAPHSVYGVPPSLWERIIRYASERKLLLHVHLSETAEEVEACVKQHGKTPPEFLEALGLWSQPAIAAHAVCLTPEDITILGKHRVGISHNPGSNLKLGSGICPVVELRGAGARVALGTDSTASNNNLDILQEADMAAKLQSFRRGAGALTAVDTTKLLTLEGAAALGLDEEIGSLEVGKSADIIAIDLGKPHAQPFYNPYSHVTYSASGQDVKHSLVQGNVLMENYQVLSLDEKAILGRAAEWGRRIRQG